MKFITKLSVLQGQYVVKIPQLMQKEIVSDRIKFVVIHSLKAKKLRAEAILKSC